MFVAFDGGEPSRVARQQGVALAKALGAALHVVVIKGHLPRQATSLGGVRGEDERIDARARRAAEQVRVLASLKGVDLCLEARYGDIADVSVDMVKEGHFDLLVVGQSDQSRIVDRITGNTVEAIARLVLCSVLMAKW
jgi:nucleotide-binding universal stress UspA family protein